jgi:hypothetical protein
MARTKTSKKYMKSRKNTKKNKKSMRKTKYLRIKGGAAAVAVANGGGKKRKTRNNNEVPEALKHTYGRGDEGDMAERKRTERVNFIARKILKYLRGDDETYLDEIKQKIFEMYDQAGQPRYVALSNVLEDIRYEVEIYGHNERLPQLVARLQVAYDA